MIPGRPEAVPRQRLFGLLTGRAFGAMVLRQEHDAGSVTLTSDSAHFVGLQAPALAEMARSDLLKDLRRL